MKSLAKGAFVLLATLSSACTYNISPYGVAADNVEALRSKLANREVGVEHFTATEPGKTSITCRAAGPVSPPNGKTYEAYIEEAMITELKVAGIYKEGATSRLKAHFTKIDFNSNIGAGNWYIDATISMNGDSFAVTSQTPFDASFVADKACQEVAQHFPIAVQNFIKAVVANPKFVRLARAAK